MQQKKGKLSFKKRTQNKRSIFSQQLPRIINPSDKVRVHSVTLAVNVQALEMRKQELEHTLLMKKQKRTEIEKKNYELVATAAQLANKLAERKEALARCRQFCKNVMDDIVVSQLIFIGDYLDCANAQQ